MKLELKPEIEAGLLARAHARGLSLEAYLDEVLQDAAEAPPRPAERKSLPRVFAESPLKGLDLKVDRDDESADAVPLPHDWNKYLRYRFEEGRKAFERGEAVDTDIDEMMDGIEAELGIAK